MAKSQTSENQGCSKTIMAVSAHHDDNELIAGTLARHKEVGWRIVSVVMTDGMYIAGKVAQEHAKIRENESIKAAEMLDMECVFLSLSECNLQSDSDTQILLLEQIPDGLLLALGLAGGGLGFGCLFIFHGTRGVNHNTVLPRLIEPNPLPRHPEHSSPRTS